MTLKRMFENLFVMVFVHNYVGTHGTEACLLSDRGHTTSLQTPNDFSMDVNICRSAFARFVFCDIDAHIPPGTPPMYVEAVKRKRSVTVQYTENDIEELRKYNLNTAYQCTKAVYCAQQTVRT